MNQVSEILTADKVLSALMDSSIDAGLRQFTELWHSSESLQLCIRQSITQGVPLLSNKVIETGTKPAKTNPALEQLISRGAVDPVSVEARSKQSYGGLSRTELLLLLERYKAGSRSLGVYLLVREWKKYSIGDALPDARLKRLTLECFEQAIRGNRSDFFGEIQQALDFLKDEEYQEAGAWKHDPAQWWQFHLLLFVLEHPQEHYAMREFKHHFEDEVGINEMPTTKTIRSFCRSHGITLNSAPGAPKKADRR